MLRLVKAGEVMNIKEIYEGLFLSIKEAGELAKAMQSTIQNEGKLIEEEVGESAYHKAMCSAKTKVDVDVQEMLLKQLYAYRDILTLDVEEESDSVQKFDRNDYEYTLIIDPIDGTLDYLKQKDTYSICIAIMHQHAIELAMVYFPRRNMMYAYTKQMGVKKYDNMLLNEVDDGKLIHIKPAKQRSKLIYKNHRLNQAYVSYLQENNYTIRDDSEDHLGCPDAILSCLKGEALACVYEMRNIRDILLIAILSNVDGCYTFDFHGHQTLWRKHGRQPEIIFSRYQDVSIFLS